MWFGLVDCIISTSYLTCQQVKKSNLAEFLARELRNILSWVGRSQLGVSRQSPSLRGLWRGEAALGLSISSFAVSGPDNATKEDDIPRSNQGEVDLSSQVLPNHPVHGASTSAPCATTFVCFLI